MSKNDNKDTIEDLKRIISLNPEFYLAYINLAWIYKLDDDIENAIKNYEKAIELEKNFAFYYELASCYEKIKDYGKAIFNYHASIVFNPLVEDKQIKIEKDAYNKIILLYMKLGKSEEAMNILSKVNEKYPDFNNSFSELYLRN